MEYAKKKRFMYFILFSLLIIPSINALTCADISNNKRPSIELSYASEIDGVYLTNYNLSNSGNEIIPLICETPINCEGPAQTYVLRPTNALPNNIYSLNLTAEDLVGNQRNSNCSFNVYNPFLNISLVTPRFGISPTESFNLSIQTSEPASVCTAYGNDLSFFEIIKIPDQRYVFQKISNTFFQQNNYQLSDQDKREVFIKCNDTEGLNNDMFPKIFEIGVDSTKPIIEVYKDPSEVTDLPLVAKIGARSEDRIYCIIRETDTPPTLFDFNLNSIEIDDFQKDFYKELNDQTIPAITEEKDYEFYMTCINRAELMSETKKVDLKVYFPNGEIKSTYPDGYINNPEPILEVATNKKGACQVKMGSEYADMNTQTQKNHTFPLAKIPDGNYSFEIKCSFISGGLNAVGVISFTLDTQKPSATTIRGAGFTCSDSVLTNNFTFFATDDSGIGGYEYKILEGTKVIREWTMGSSTPDIDGLELESSKTYTLYARAVDSAGNPGDYNQMNFVLDPSKKECVYEGPPKVELIKNMTNDGLSVTMNCISNVGCTIRKYFIIEPDSACKTCEECPNRYVYVDAVKITKNGDNKFCYSVQDSLGGQTNGSETIKYNGTKTEPPKKPIITSNREDADNDGILDDYETLYSSCGLSSRVFKDRYYDSDNDGLYNIEEFELGTNPCFNDHDGDGILDGGERTSQTNPNQTNSTPIDSDNDGIDDNWEFSHFGSLEEIDATTDYDNDTLKDLQEYLYNTDPTIKDTDQDNLGDGEEINQHKTWPTKSDTDEDAYDDFIEIDQDKDPLNPRDYPQNKPIINEPPIEDPKPEKISMTAIILSIIGLILVTGGTAYLFYDYYYLAKKREPKTNPAQTPQKNSAQTQPTQTNLTQKNTQQTNNPGNPENKNMNLFTTRFSKRNEEDPNSKRLFQLRMQKKHQKRKDLLNELDNSKNPRDKEQVSLSFDQFSKTKNKNEELKTRIAFNKYAKPKAPEKTTLPESQKNIATDKNPPKDNPFQTLDNLSKNEKTYTDQLGSIIKNEEPKTRIAFNKYAKPAKAPEKTTLPASQKNIATDKNPPKDNPFQTLDNLSKNEKTYTDQLDSIIKNEKEQKTQKEEKNQKQENLDKLQSIIEGKNITSTKKLDELSKENKQDPLKKLDELQGKSLNPKKVFESLTDLINDREARTTLTQATQKKELNKQEIMQTLSQLASQPKLMDIEIFKVVLSKLLETQKISKSDVSTMLFELEGRKAIDKNQLLLILKELKISK